MYSHTASSQGNVDIELPLADAGRIVDIDLMMAMVTRRVGPVAHPFEPTLSQVAAYPLAGLRPQDFLGMGS